MNRVTAILEWVLNNKFFNAVYGPGTDQNTMSHKMHGLLLLLLYSIAIALGFYFWDFNNAKEEWYKRGREDSELYRQAIKYFYQQVDSTKGKQ